jgi:hypothetical protein
MCMTDYDPPSVYSKQERIARVAHDCSECGRTILKGEPYQYVSGIWDGYASSHSTCSHCEVVQAWLLENCHGFMHTQIGEDIEGHARDYNRPDLARLFVGMRRKWARFKPAAFEGMQVPKLPRLLKLGDAHG